MAEMKGFRKLLGPAEHPGFDRNPRLTTKRSTTSLVSTLHALFTRNRKTSQDGSGDSFLPLSSSPTEPLSPSSRRRTLSSATARYNPSSTLLPTSRELEIVPPVPPLPTKSLGPTKTRSSQDVSARSIRHSHSYHFETGGTQWHNGKHLLPPPPAVPSKASVRPMQRPSVAITTDISIQAENSKTYKPESGTLNTPSTARSAGASAPISPQEQSALQAHQLHEALIMNLKEIRQLRSISDAEFQKILSGTLTLDEVALEQDIAKLKDYERGLRGQWKKEKNPDLGAMGRFVENRLHNLLPVVNEQLGMALAIYGGSGLTMTNQEGGRSGKA